MWLLPTWNRPASLIRFIDAYFATGATTPGLVLTDQADYDCHYAWWRAPYTGNAKMPCLPFNWQFVITKSRNQGDKTREIWDEIKDCSWLGLIGDDCIPVTPKWDALLTERLSPWSIISCNDAWQAPARLGNCWIMGGDLVRAMGGIFPGKLQHLFVDDVWETIGKEAQCWECRMDVTVRHAHVLKGEAKADETHTSVYGVKGDHSDGLWPEDAAEYKRWLEEDAPRVVQTVRQNRAELGLTQKTEATQQRHAGLWLLPSPQSPETAQRFLRLCLGTGMQSGGVILVHKDTKFANILTIPINWYWYTTDAEDAAEQVREFLTDRVTDDLDWLGVLSDELIPETPGWDAALITRVTGANIVCANDGWQAPKHIHSAMVFSVPLLKAVGYFAPPGVGDNRINDLWETIGRDTGCIQWATDVMLKRQATRNQRRPFPDCEAAYRRWMESGRAKARDAIFALAEQHGDKVTRADLSGASIMLAVPAHDGKYEDVFVESMMATVEAVTAAGGSVNHARLNYCADIGLARARLLGSFLRSSHTHLLMIDADMGWSPQDVLRLTDLKVDFAAAAGPKKTYPIRYAFESATESGQPKPIRVGPDGVSFEVSGVGMAFCMITRACAEKMIAAYPELAFRTDSGAVDYGLFDPVYIEMRRMSEDYSFCHRWTKIGGKIYMLPQIRLKHVGANVWEGCLMDDLMARSNQQVA
jgi:hypothetical protein